MIFSNIKMYLIGAGLLTIVGLLAFSTHLYLMRAKDKEIADLTEAVTTITTERDRYRTANEENINTIATLRNSAKKTATLVNTLQENQASITADRDRYLSIFRKHDLLQLSLAKPGLVESRINAGTADAFRQIELETQTEPKQ